MISIQGNSQDMDRLRADFDDKYMSMIATDEIPNMEFVTKLVIDYNLQVTVGLVTYSPESNGLPYSKLAYGYFIAELNDGDDEDDL